MRALLVILLAASAWADPLPEGAELKLLSPDAGQLLRADLRRIDVRWSATRLPDRSLVRIRFRVGEGKWRTAVGGSYVPAQRGRFSMVVPKTRESGDLAVGLEYLAPHEPKRWLVERPDGLAAIQAQVRPGDTVQCTTAELDAGIHLPSGVTLKGAPGTGTSVILGKRSGLGLVIHDVAGSEWTARIENLRFRVGREKPARMMGYPHGAAVHGGRAELVDCVFDKGLGTGILVKGGGRVVAKNCRFSVEGGTGVHAQEFGSTAVVEGGIMTQCGEGVVGDGGTTLHCSGVTMQDLRYSGISNHGWPLQTVTVHKCKLLRMRDGINVRALDRLVVSGCEIDVLRLAIRIHGEQPMSMRGKIIFRTRTNVKIENNTVRNATIGIEARDLAECTIVGNRMNGIDFIALQLDCPATVERNSIQGTQRPREYAPPHYVAYWRLRTTGVVYGLIRGEAKPVIRGNRIHGCSTHAIVLVGGAEATMAENKFNVTNAVGRIARPSRAHDPEDQKAWGRVRGNWEHRNPGEKKKRK